MSWPQVLTLHPDAQLLIVGEEPASDALQEKAVELGCADSIDLPSHRNNVPDVLNLVDAFVFPSHFEGIPEALLETMAAGLPIGTTPINGSSELVTDGETGLFVPPRSPTELSNQINHLLVDPGHAKNG